MEQEVEPPLLAFFYSLIIDIKNNNKRPEALPHGEVEELVSGLDLDLSHVVDDVPQRLAGPSDTTTTYFFALRLPLV